MHIRIPLSRQSAARDYLSPVVICGAIAALIGLVVIAGWHARFERVLRLQDDYQAMAYRSAIGMAATGVALVLLGTRRAGSARLVAAVVAGASLLSVAGNLIDVPTGIERLLANPYTLGNTTRSSGVAPQTAIGLTTACLAIVLMTARRPVRHRSFVTAVAGSLIISIGIVALAGYLTGFEQAYGWGRFTAMSAQTAIGFLIVGTGIFALGWGEARTVTGSRPRWLFAPIAIGAATLSILFCQALLAYEDRQIELAANVEAISVQQEVQTELDASIGIVERAARRWETGGRPDQARWQTTTRLTFDGTSIFQAIEWVDPAYTAKWIVPREANRLDIGLDLSADPNLRPLLDTARSNRETVISPPIDRGRGDLEVLVIRAIYIDGAFDGFLTGTIRVDHMFRTILDNHVASSSSIAVYDGRQRLFERSPGHDQSGRAWEVELPAQVRNVEWTLQVWPTNIAPYRSILPYGSLVLGFVVAGLLGLVTWLMQQAQERTRAIQVANASLEVEIAERRRTEEELRQSSDALERSNRSLQEFAYVASHDLKAPLVSLQGLATMLKADAGDKLEGDTRLYLDRIVANATKMRNLLDDLLELARVEREDAPVSAVDLDDIIEGVTDQLRQTIDERQAQVVVNGRMPTVAANPVRLHQVFANLIDNAMKYTPSQRTPRIEIGADEAGDQWHVFVRDNGAGIAPEHRDKIFTMFQRLPKGRAMNPTGTGMGLAIVSRIIEANGGQCWIDASDEDGTTFCLTFPKPAHDQLNSLSRTPQSAGVATQ